MARIASLGLATQDIYLIDRDDFVGADIAGSSIFGHLVIGSQVDIDRVHFAVGGGGTNSATTFARYGHESILISSISRDISGEAVTSCLDRENIASSYLEFDRSGTACSVILLDAKTTQHTTLSFRGTKRRFSHLSPDSLLAISPDWLYASSLGGDMRTLLRFFEQAHLVGAKVMFNPGLDEMAEIPKLIGLLDDVDVLLVNKQEAAKIVPGVLLTELLVRLARYCPTVIITDGEMGAIATDHSVIYRLSVYEQVKARDGTGVGDAFGSGFLASLASGDNFEEALQFASANAASVIRSYGPKAGILNGTEPLHPMPIQTVTDIKLD